METHTIFLPPCAPTILHVYYQFKTNLESFKSILIMFHIFPGVLKKKWYKEFLGSPRLGLDLEANDTSRYWSSNA